MTKVALIGWGAIGHAVARLLAYDEIDIVAVAVRDTTRDRPDLPAGAQLLADPSAIAGCGADVVAEAAGRESVGPWCGAAIDAGIDVIVSSVSAFADQALLDDLTARASSYGAQLHIQPGALGGVDALNAAGLMGIDQVEHRIVKPPRAWQGTPAVELCDLDALTEETVFFQGNAAETAVAFSKNANVAMTTALAGIGPERTVISLVADPASTQNRHEISASGAFGTLEVALANNPLPENPKSSAMAALNLARAIRNRDGTVVL